ncbi:MAG: hypothetical protein KatS3mg121_1027 [Gammaproteobacteria bacterium]|nr:MAG: hypothetical protein KatS3mg121_1027 [Gammaproteobacteria bacterium]
MNAIGVYCAAADRREAAAGLAARWGLPWLTAPPAAPHLCYDAAGLALAGGPDDPPPLRLDFDALARRRRGAEPLLRAVGARPGLTVLDATAGLARDAFLLARAGCRVTAVERLAALLALVDEALARCREQTAAAARLRLLAGDAMDRLRRWHGAPPAVVYLDPMYEPDTARRGAVKKDAQWLRRLAGEEAAPAAWLGAALELAAERVVVKRHRNAPPLGGRPPDWRVGGRRTRFDVYRVRRTTTCTAESNAR